MSAAKCRELAVKARDHAERAAQSAERAAQGQPVGSASWRHCYAVADAANCSASATHFSGDDEQAFRGAVDWALYTLSLAEKEAE
jgi:hypothetical protein